ncbi:MAG TPA: phospholipase domain-containing protein, partial [Thiobacillus sp.]
RSYTVEPRKQLTDVWTVTSSGAASDYDLSVYGPNGFLRAFKGGISGARRARLDARARYDESGHGIVLEITNKAMHTAKVHVLDQYTGRHVEAELKPGANFSKHWSLKRVFGWYDLLVTVEGDAGFECHFAGHVETGKGSISDPAMGGLVPDELPGLVDRDVDAAHPEREGADMEHSNRSR